MQLKRWSAAYAFTCVSACVSAWVSNSTAAYAAEIAIPSPSGTMRAFWFEADPAVAKAKAPVVISLHGCGGAYSPSGALNLSSTEDSKRFAPLGVHVLVLDGFTHRGATSICAIATANRSISEETRRTDLQSAFEWLAAQSNVNIKKIILLGRSHGAQTVLAALDQQFMQSSPIAPIAAIAFYPGCTKYLRQSRYRVGAPLLLMIGELDDWTPAFPCSQLAASAGSDNATITFEQFPDSYHGFDSTSPVHTRSNVGNTRSGTATVGGNAQARLLANTKILQWVKEIAATQD